MLKKSLYCAVIVALILTGISKVSFGAPKPSGSPPALTGIVTSDAEGPMEGVVVRAKRVGGTVSVSVVSDDQGRYSFPADRLTPGKYEISIRAVGYDLANPKLVATVGTKTSQVDIKLNKTANLAAQLTSAEWILSAPGTPAQKNSLYSCINCHQLKPVFDSTYDIEGMMKDILEMRSDGPSTSLVRADKLPYHSGPRPNDRTLAEYLTSINLSGGKTHWNFELKTLPRPKGKSTRVIITEYDLPRPETMPSFAVMDEDGMIWYGDFTTNVLGRLDPRTAKTKEWTLPIVRPGFDPGSLCVRVDRDGNVWVARSMQMALARFDKKTEKITTWSLPKEYRELHTRISYLVPTPQGKVWTEDTFNRTMVLFDPATAHWDIFNAFPGWKWSWDTDNGAGGRGPTARGHFIQSVGSDSRGWGYFCDIAGGNIGEVDPETGKVTLYTPPTPNSGVRLMHIDSEDRIWFGEDKAGKIGMFDIKTKQFKEWTDPEPLNDDYDVVPDKAGYVWTGGMATDIVTRLDPKTGEMTQYMLPTLDVNIRSLDIDNFTTPPSLVVGENHRGRIALVTPLD
jgi:virginiamycin B lyase